MTAPALLVAAFLVAPFAASGADSSWTPERQMQMKRVGGTSVSPDGRWVAYTVGVARTDSDHSDILTHIWVVSSDGKSNRRFTYGDKSCTAPAFAPTGERLAFLTARGKDENSQVWVIHLGGGEAVQVTSARSGVEAFAWSPDGSRIAYTSVDPDTPEEERAKKEKRDMVVVDRNLKYAHLYAVTVNGAPTGPGASRRLTRGEFHVAGFNWSPDGKTIAFSHQATPSPDTWPTSDISMVPADSGSVRALAAEMGMEMNPRWSPDGSTVAFLWDEGVSHWARAYDVFLVPSAGGARRKVGSTPDRNFVIAGWTKDGRELLLTETERTNRRIYSMSVASGMTRDLTEGEGLFTNPSFSADGGTMAWIRQDTELPADVYAGPVAKGKGRKLTDIHAGANFPPLAKTEAVRWASPDGKEIEGLLTYPAGYIPGRRYPLVLNIHGGPAGVFVRNFTVEPSVFPLQSFAAAGYAVLRPNPRGSSGYGAEFRLANTADWGFGDYEDDMAGVEKAIAMGVAHPDSLVICGWSYGGYMTSFAITRTTRFKSACVGAGVTNLMSFVGTADIPGFLPSYFEGEHWEKPGVYAKHSAMFNVGKISTPTLILHGEKDLRVPVSQGYELYVALKRRGVPVEMVTYPRMPHSFTEPKFTIDAGKRMIEWFDRSLGRR